MEELTSAIISILDTNLAAELASIQAAHSAADIEKYGAELNLDDIREYCFGDRSQINDFPAVLVIGDIERPEGVIADKPSYLTTVEYIFDVRLFIMGDDEERVNVRIVRYAKALKNILGNNWALGGLSLYGGVGDISYSPIIKQGEGPQLFRGISIAFTATKTSRN